MLFQRLTFGRVISCLEMDFPGVSGPSFRLFDSGCGESEREA